MKKIIFIIATVISSVLVTAQIAPNFNSNDCNGTNYDLYAQLDAGKVIVVCWVMPCSSCISGAKTSYNVVQSFQTSNPNKVFYYLCDDYGDTPCASINSWANSNSIPASASSLRFSNSAISMSNYGSIGMPKITVIGGSSHSIFYNVNGTVVGTELQTAISNALNANGVEENDNITSEIKIFSNPVNSNLNLSFSIEIQSLVTIEMYDILGKKVYSNAEKFNKGLNKMDINTNKLNNGIYFIKLSDTYRSRTLKFNVSH
ncbi:MAG: T9SS type A sorting domain-containing protein [Bacteroidales bacterium]